MTSAQGLDLETAWAHQASVQLDGVPVRFIGLEQLKVNKRAVGRPEDLADVEALEP